MSECTQYKASSELWIDVIRDYMKLQGVDTLLYICHIFETISKIILNNS